MQNFRPNREQFGEERLNLVGLNALPNRYYTPARMRRIAVAQAMEWVFRNSGINVNSLASNNGWGDGEFYRRNVIGRSFGSSID